DADAAPVGDGDADPLAGEGHVAEQEGVVRRLLALQEPSRPLGVRVATPDEHRRRDVADAERANELGLRAVVARADRPGAVVHRATTLRVAADGIGPWDTSTRAVWTSRRRLGAKLAHTRDGFPAMLCSFPGWVGVGDGTLEALRTPRRPPAPLPAFPRAPSGCSQPSRGSSTPRTVRRTSSARPASQSASTSRGRRLSRSDATAIFPQKITSPSAAPPATTITGARYTAFSNGHAITQAVSTTSASTPARAAGRRSIRMAQGYASLVDSAGNYYSGDDYVVEFLGYRFCFSAFDFEQRVTAAAVKLGLLPGSELDPDETADLVELVERDAIEEPRSSLGRYLVRHWDEIALVQGESLVYWLKKL